ncbi:hypothetical protein BH780_gp030 [Bacillus phage Eldridge]|uniref:Uncharacterized protein n=1 Tax=Bacillus phage Eldridge TaxID=1776293 RepID=A0A0Y0ALX4_9CAUD|nr:hypothetical protein BH780_gp030 [Bacillus phage Eldridge]AMB18613.1 hypothetical protein Eldridge_030 [Bacillus phage Eldridge]
MVSKNVVAIYKEFRRIKDQVNYIQSMYEQDVDKTLEVRALAIEPGFVEAAYELLDDVKEFVKLIEESDPNLDPDTTKLEGVDNLFKGHFVTDHMNNVFNEVYNSQGVCPSAPCKTEDENCCKNQNREFGENEIRDDLFEGLCWCQFKRKLKRMNLTVDTAPISAAMLSSIEATRSISGECFHCENSAARPCGPECIDPCPCFDKE